MRIRVIASNSKNKDLDGDITELIGQEFDVVSKDKEGVYIKYDLIDEYFLYYDEVEMTSK
ncbi:hypothetical protein [Brevibacillus brevis]|uniref:hypothetical protein n=1 Tax=Brevibacillus brevis TaxID=1393 RepID=UPI0007D8C0FA|nr:hypothetical protein [Brevibacillus brevis]